MKATPLTWTHRVLWFLLPFTLGDLLSDSLADHSTAVATTGAVIAWATWATGLGISFVPLPSTLTVVRILAPVPVVAGVVAATQALSGPAAPDALGWVGLVISVVSLVAVMSPEVGDWFVNGGSYGDERRMPLRPPVMLLFGPIEVVWVLTVAPVVVGCFLLAARAWVLGVVVTIVGVVTALIGFRILHRLARRWIVFVPAGMTIVDDFALAEPILLPRARITALGPAMVDSTALDLTASASGLILQVDLDRPVEVVPQVRRGSVATATTTTAVLIGPGRPGALLDHAESRRIHVTRA